MVTDEDVSALEEEVERQVKEQMEKDGGNRETLLDSPPDPALAAAETIPGVIEPKETTPEPKQTMPVPKQELQPKQTMPVPKQELESKQTMPVPKQEPEPKQTMPVPKQEPAPKQPAAPTASGNLAAALTDDDPPLALSEVNDPVVEQQVREALSKMDEKQFARALRDAKHHPEYASYIKAVQLEIGLDCDEWTFGDQEPEEDLVGLHCYAICKKRLRERLGLPPPKEVVAHPSDGTPAAQVPAAVKTAGIAHPSQQGQSGEASIVPQPGTMFFAPPCSTFSAKASAEAPGKEATMPPPILAVPKVPALPSVPTSPAVSLQLTPAASPSPTAPPEPEASPKAAAAADPKAASPVPEAAANPKAPPPQAVADPKAPPAPAGLSQQVDAAIKNVQAEDVKPTSVTHRAEYMAYLRAGANPNKLPPSLRQTFSSNDSRLDLFRLWLEKGRDFNACQIEIQRRNTQQKKATNKRGCLSRAQLLKDPRYSEADVDALIARKTAEGAWVPDENFPERVDLRQYVVHIETTGEDNRIRDDVQSLTATASTTAEDAIPMLDNGNAFAMDSAPTVKSFAAESTGVDPATPALPEPKAKSKARGKAKAKAKGVGKGEDPENPEPDLPPTPIEKAKKLANKVFFGWFTLGYGWVIVIYIYIICI